MEYSYICLYMIDNLLFNVKIIIFLKSIIHFMRM